MQSFTVVEGVAAPLPLADIDASVIMPRQFLKTRSRRALRQGVFYDARFDIDGVARDEFVLNRDPYRGARFLVAGSNFGCGSNCEHAVWGLVEFGIRGVIAPSFGEIFRNSAFENGMLLATLPGEQVERLLLEVADARTASLDVDLPQQLVRSASQALRFDIDSHYKNRLINADDAIEFSMRSLADIERFECERQSKFPWL